MAIEAKEKAEKEKFYNEKGIFSAIADDFFDNMALSNKNQKSVADQRQRVQANIIPMLGHKNINEIEMLDIKKAIDIIINRGRIETANRTLDLIKRIFRYAKTLTLLEKENAYIVDDISELKKILPKKKVTHFYKKHLDESEVAELITKIHGSKDRWTFQVSIALRLAPYIFLRPSELVNLEWSEIDFDKKCIRINAKRMKMGREHIVPLSSQALALLMDIGQYTVNSPYVFCGRDRTKPITLDTLRMCLRRLGYEGIQGDNKPFTTHAFRGLASSILHQNLRFPSDLIELQLAHIEEGSVKAAYNRLGPFAMFEERQNMMQVFADYLDKLRQEK